MGWKGLIMDPHLDGSDDIPEGLRIARRFLRDVIDLGVPTATELLDPITPQYIADLICWSAIGARTTESQTHRQMASGLSMPLGFKNATPGTIGPAINAIQAARQPQTFLGISGDGVASAVSTTGNPDCHLVLRGGDNGPNYSAEHVAEAERQLAEAGSRRTIMIDCSHGNSGTRPRRQPECCGTSWPSGSPAPLDRRRHAGEQPGGRQPAVSRPVRRPGLRPIHYRCLHRLGDHGAARAGNGGKARPPVLINAGDARYLPVGPHVNEVAHEVLFSGFDLQLVLACGLPAGYLRSKLQTRPTREPLCSRSRAAAKPPPGTREGGRFSTEPAAQSTTGPEGLHHHATGSTEAGRRGAAADQHSLLWGSGGLHGVKPSKDQDYQAAEASTDNTQRCPSGHIGQERTLLRLVHEATPNIFPREHLRSCGIRPFSRRPWRTRRASSYFRLPHDGHRSLSMEARICEYNSGSCWAGKPLGAASSMIGMPRIRIGDTVGPALSQRSSLIASFSLEAA